MRSARRSRHKRGFTLVELIMTIVLIGITAVPLSLMVVQHIQSVYISHDYAVARNLARFEMEVVNNTAYASIASASFPNYRGYNYDVNRNVTFAQGNSSSSESLKRVAVSVTRHGSAAALFNSVTYIAKNVNYGL